MKERITLLVLILALLPGGCAPKIRKFVLPAAPRAEVKPLPEANIETPPEIETPVPIVEIPWPPMSPAKGSSKAEPAQEKKPQQAHLPPGQAPTEPEPVTPPPVVTPPPAPRLGEILSDTRRREYEGDFNRYVADATAVLKRASTLRLNDSQRLTVTRIKTFLEQAEASRARDLATASTLARRAYLLGQDLLKSLH